MKKVESIIFVCLGNICRSPIAEGIAKREVSKRGLDIKIASAGTGDWHIGEAPCENSIRIAKEKGVDISHQRAHQITANALQQYDRVIALDDSNLTNIKKVGSSNLSKLGSYGFNNEDVPDPFFFPGFEGFEKVYNMIEVCVCNLLDELKD